MRSAMLWFLLGMVAMLLIVSGCTRRGSELEQAQPVYGLAEHRTLSGMECAILTDKWGTPVSVSCLPRDSIPAEPQPSLQRVPL